MTDFKELVEFNINENISFAKGLLGAEDAIRIAVIPGDGIYHQFLHTGSWVLLPSIKRAIPTPRQTIDNASESTVKLPLRRWAIKIR